MKFKTAAGMVAYNLGEPLPEDPGMTEQEWIEWQKSVFMDALTPEQDPGPAMIDAWGNHGDDCPACASGTDCCGN